MTLRLSVETAAWRAHVDSTVAALGEVMPVVKGNGYGFGRHALMSHAARLSGDVAVGTAHELGDVPAGVRPFVLTPVGAPVGAIERTDAVLTVASDRDLDVLERIGGSNPVVVKVESSMRRYGAPPERAAELRRRAESGGRGVVAWSIHLPLSGDDGDRAREVLALAGPLSSDLPLHVSHVGGAAHLLRSGLPHRVVVRTGTRLWLGDKSMLSLRADAIAVRRVAAGVVAGYRHTVVGRAGSLVMVGCGSSHGVGPLEDGRSPFHFAGRRLNMLESPHMHTTMLLVDDDPLPGEGDWVDVQQPLTRVHPDVVDWR